MLFEEIEKKIREREMFVQEQSERLREMDEGHNTLKDYLEVLQKAQKLQISGPSARPSMDSEIGGNAINDNRATDANPLMQGADA